MSAQNKKDKADYFDNNIISDLLTEFAESLERKQPSIKKPKKELEDDPYYERLLNKKRARYEALKEKYRDY